MLFDGRPSSRVKFGYVFQNYREALFPWLPAFDNIAYPLKLMGVPKAERARRVERLVAHLGVKIDLALYPYDILRWSGQSVNDTFGQLHTRHLIPRPAVLPRTNIGSTA